MAVYGGVIKCLGIGRRTPRYQADARRAQMADRRGFELETPGAEARSIERHRRRCRQFACAFRLVAQRRAREFERTIAVDRRADIVFAEYADARHDESGYHTTETRRMKDGLNSVHGSHAAGASIALQPCDAVRSWDTH